MLRGLSASQPQSLPVLPHSPKERLSDYSRGGGCSRGWGAVQHGGYSIGGGGGYSNGGGVQHERGSY